MTQDVALIVDGGQLYTDAAAYIPTIDPTISVLFGRREITKQINQGTGRAGRVVFVPGDDTGKAGQYGGPKLGARWRQVATEQELVSVHIWAWDGSAPTVELAQYRAVKRLHTIVLNSLRMSAMGRYTLQDPEWVITPIERSFGSALWVRLLLEVPVLQIPAASNVRATQVEETVSIKFPSGDEQSCPPT